MSGPRHNRGFTLLEVVVALTVTAMLLVVVYNSLHLGIRAQRAVASAVHDNDQTRAFTYFLRRQFRHLATPAENEALRFSGDPHGVRGVLLGFRGDPALHLLRLRALPELRPSRLVATIQRLDPGSDRATGDVLQSGILAGLRGVEFSFYGAPDGRGVPSWQDRWDSSEHPPRLLRLSYLRAGQPARVLYLPVAGADGNQVPSYAAAVSDR